MTKSLEKQLNGCYTRLKRMVFSVHWKEHLTNEELYGTMMRVTDKIQERRMWFAEFVEFMFSVQLKFTHVTSDQFSLPSKRINSIPLIFIQFKFIRYSQQQNIYIYLVTIKSSLVKRRSN